MYYSILLKKTLFRFLLCEIETKDSLNTFTCLPVKMKFLFLQNITNPNTTFLVDAYNPVHS